MTETSARKLTETGAAFWVWLAAVIGGPFLPLLVSRPFAHFYQGQRLPGLAAAVYIGLPVWALALVAASAWLGSRMRGPARGSGCGFQLLMTFLGAFVSVCLGWLGCSLFS